MKIKYYMTSPSLITAPAPLFGAEQDRVIDSPPILRARPEDGRHDQLFFWGFFKWHFWGELLRASTDLRRVQRIDLGAALALALIEHPSRLARQDAAEDGLLKPLPTFKPRKPTISNAASIPKNYQSSVAWEIFHSRQAQPG
jgi:hypothetical protein